MSNKEKEVQEETEEQQVVDSQEETQETVVENEEESSEETEEKAEPSVEDELKEFKDKYLRLHAEFENFRKRTNKEKAEFLLSANKGLILDLLPVVDYFERAIASNEKVDDANTLKEGFGLIYNKFFKIIEGKGVTPINATGKEFDTELHEAVTQIPAPTDELKGKVVDEIEKGYFIGEKVLRHSKVVIGS